MKIIVCVDDNLGMMFNRRRQSQDRIVREDILKLKENKKLWMNSYSKEQFQESRELNINEDFLEKAESDDYCFVENLHISGIIDKVEEIIIYCWNKKYPANFYFDVNLTNGDWRLVGSKELEGYSHEKISREIWRKL